MKIIEQLSTTSGFINRFMQHCINKKTQTEAYEATEKEYEALFNRKKYTDYNSFRQVKNRKLKRKH